MLTYADVWYAFQSAGRAGPLASSVEELPIEDITDGETAVAEGVAFAKWRVYLYADVCGRMLTYADVC